MKITVEIKDEDALLIKEQLKIDMEIAVKKLAEYATEALAQVARMKKAGIKIDLEKLMWESFKLGGDAAREARKK